MINNPYNLIFLPIKPFLSYICNAFYNSFTVNLRSLTSSKFPKLFPILDLWNFQESFGK